MSAIRRARLERMFDMVLRGKQDITPQNAALFLEAACLQKPLEFMDRITSETRGLEILQQAMLSDLEPARLNGQAAQVISILQDPALAAVAGGSVLQQIVAKLGSVQLLISAYKRSLLSRSLDDSGQLAFIWLLTQLCGLPGDAGASHREFASDCVEVFLDSTNLDVKSRAQVLQRAASSTTASSIHTAHGPGGRHDNDFVGIREIAILPTSDEIQCKKPPFLLRALELEAIPEDSRPAAHLENQFRLLREDMKYELLDELEKLQGRRKGNRAFTIEGLRLHGVKGSEGARDRNISPWGLQLECVEDLPFFRRDQPQDRKAYLTKEKRLLKHRSLACLIVDNEIVAFPTVHRDEELLARALPVIVLILEGETAIMQTLLKLRTADPATVRLLQVETAVFAYEPVLKALQRMSAPALSEELFLWEEGLPTEAPPHLPDRIVASLQKDPHQDLAPLLGSPDKIILDSAQSTSLLAALTQRVSLIQGPPGTGKSFVGSIVAKILHDNTDVRIAVSCFTNHALDQFLEELLDHRIPASSMVRLGGKSTSRTESLSLWKQAPVSQRVRTDYVELDGIRATMNMLHDRLEDQFERYRNGAVSGADLMAFLEIEAPAFFSAFKLPVDPADDGMTKVAKGGRKITELYLFQQWSNGQGPGVFARHPNLASESSRRIWALDAKTRRLHLDQWQQNMLRELAAEVYKLGQRYNEAVARLKIKLDERDLAILRSKRIIACTTTGAAMYTDILQAAEPDVLLVEEAGEILESHVLTALGKSTQHMILIGDHQQLRPKVNNYALTLEKNEGFELNVSLFERLVRAEYPHTTLQKQHRMRPEISEMIRHLTYPDLVDADKTRGRPNLRGASDNVIFITHAHPEDEMRTLSDTRDGGSKSSKRNTHEVNMVLKLVKFLAQQGYSTQDVVVLTPYLGQLYHLRDALKKDTDPYLSDMDMHDLVRAGLVPPGAAKLNRKPLRLSTIDNYQGEESEIVIISLTRSNSARDIGFMFSPQRLNVLLSRARTACIIIGNAETFRRSRNAEGAKLWSKFFDFITDRGHFYEGLPFRCERHPERVALLSKPTDFEQQCPDGGCTAPCDTLLSCGQHKCPSRCHNLADHSKVPCGEVLETVCPKGHKRKYKCYVGPAASCGPCDKEAKKEEERVKKEFELQLKREREQQEYERELAAIALEVEAVLQKQKDEDLAQQRANALANKREELSNAKARMLRQRQAKVSPATTPGPVPAASPSTGPSAALSPSSPNVPSKSPSKASPSTFGPTLNEISSSKASSAPAADVSAQQPSPPLSSPRTAPPNPDPTGLSSPLPESPSKLKWEQQKQLDGASNKHIDALMEMTGLESVKAQVLAIRDRIELSQRQGASMADERFNISLLGNPGTGKTTVARLYAKFLTSVDLLPGEAFEEVTGSRLSNEGVDGAKKRIEKVMAQNGGAIFVDEAYQLVGEKNFGGGAVLDFLLAEMENNVGKVIFILAGYDKEMEAFFEHNVGIPSRVPHTLRFADYTDHELIHMFESYVTKKYQGQMKIEDGPFGLYARIAIKRLARGRGQPGFGNARAMQNMFAKIAQRQAVRIEKERKAGMRVDDLLFTMGDMIGPDPSVAVAQSAAWTKLKEMIGLGSVKQSVLTLVATIGRNYQRELQELKPIQYNLNRVFLGNPGTGKTTVAKLYGRILADIGMLSNGEVIVKGASDLKGKYVGHSESQTKAVLKNAMGKVLVIDEAYQLYKGGSSKDANSHSDTFGTAAIDTIVAEVQAEPGEDRCVILIGYEKQMQDMFQNVNPGLSRRFQIEEAFRFEDYDEAELLQIMNLKLKQQDLDATVDAKKVAIDVLGRERIRPNFGNGGAVENILGKAKAHFQARQAKLSPAEQSFAVVFEPSDFDPDFDRVSRSATNLSKLFEDVVDAEGIMTKFSRYQKIARVMRTAGKEPREARGMIPTTYIFKGPPGTGKTTTARKLGQVYFDMGMLSAAEVVECSTTDMVGQYVGQTGPKVRSLCEKALGKVLFVDEAYRLADGRFGQEAVDELVSILTEEEFRGKLIVVLAGYEEDMKRLLQVNAGLQSRFEEEIIFPNFSAPRCFDILVQQIKRAQPPVRSPELERPKSNEAKQLISIFQSLCQLSNWGNARDVITLATRMIQLAIDSVDADALGSGPLTLRWSDALSCARVMLAEKRARLPNASQPRRSLQDDDLPEASMTPEPPAPSVAPPQTDNESISSSPTPTVEQAFDIPPPTSSATGKSSPGSASPTTASHVQREAGVSAETWRQLQADKATAQAEEKRRLDEMAALAKALQEAMAREEAEKKRAIELAQAVRRARDARAKAEAERRLEAQRQAKIAAQRERERAWKEHMERKKREDERKKREEEAQRKLRHMGLCEAGFQWIQQAGGYRCSAGGHYVSNAQLGM
ncbi:unnamed protein product [Peniophora sp. CBMAI 1063]|nr:unnamed protein product [Peniophora sp. CBMAI 1063]